MHKCELTERGSNTTSSAHGQAQSLRAMMEHNQLHDPLHNIPPEIVSSIFRFSGEPDSGDRILISNTTTILDESLRRCRWPLELSSVCARWRTIALGDPRLWTTIAMYRRGEIWTLPLELVQQRVSRCGSLPFQLSLWWDTEAQAADENFVSLIRFLCARCTRWRGLILRVPSHVNPFFKHNATHTLDLELFHIDATDDPNLDHFWDMENTVIRPRNATFMGLATLPKSSSWSNLVNLCLRTVRVCDLLPITSQCKNIKSLELTFRRTRPSDMNQLPIEPLTLPHLTKLFIVFAAPLDLNFFMTFTRLPVLRYLVMFYLGDGERHFDLSILQNAMTPCKTLRSIYFQNISFASEDLLRLLSRFQHLKVLRFVNTAEGVATVPWLDALFNRLTTSLSDGP
ncbi:hypothetical protein D9619_002410 [Psilocybe cf. subviscida]|uniref:F-box domain-containing protein n=1 Tax=Psilocybe cf. subviscida TaxID=2480587 RepID=A0A8H5AY36_9AGAR|nr:hypothetical protein D9619_002410 [Psilocybe cf. subviscida]